MANLPLIGLDLRILRTFRLLRILRMFKLARYFEARRGSKWRLEGFEPPTFWFVEIVHILTDFDKLQLLLHLTRFLDVGNN